MSTKLKPPPRRFSTLGASNKRKERDGFDAHEIPKIPKFTTPQAATVTASPKSLEPASHNRLLAGYLAHEFLTKGTVFGEKCPSARAEAKPVPAELKKGRGGAELKMEALKRYVAVSDLLKTDGAHIPGIINPTQLGRYLQM
ncbi:uncharacterized protein LOC100253191 [Vitis vinifera]|uniref:Embryo sac development arrest 6 n=1 Tax=Vitis vinifera TaxID=29760 RepID=A5C3J8_VITVI|nr:uncharacterized protein LOC100253191 [Vitis vinifera]CAN75265.1 hypothetical protein VITISV_003344 [Vitis vinifera]|eukprot:XP_002275835.1 PREDICTED: uncharacterized protein LOC100253191 [Vitis vinifera]